MFCGVFASMMTTSNKAYLDTQYCELVRDLAAGAGFRFITSKADVEAEAQRQRS